MYEDMKRKQKNVYFVYVVLILIICVLTIAYFYNLFNKRTTIGGVFVEKEIINIEKVV